VVLGIGLAPAAVARKLRRSVGLPERDGLLVRGVEDGSPAAVAGLAEGDLLVAAAGRPLLEVDDLFDELDRIEPGGTLELTVLRGTEERTVTVSFPPAETGDAPETG
jgi:S1-C subfamily serine protease